MWNFEPNDLKTGKSYQNLLTKHWKNSLRGIHIESHQNPPKNNIFPYPQNDRYVLVSTQKKIGIHFVSGDKWKNVCSWRSNSWQKKENDLLYMLQNTAATMIFLCEKYSYRGKRQLQTSYLMCVAGHSSYNVISV